MKFIAIAILSLIALPVLATSYAPPESKEVYSENKAHYIKISADSDIQQVMSKDGKKPVWTFEYRHDRDEYFVSNDGNRVVIVKWKHCTEETVKMMAIRIIKQGKVEAQYSYEQLCTPRKRTDREIGPIGDFWRIWKEQPSTVKDQNLTVEATGRKPIVIDLTTGKMMEPESKIQK